MIARALDIRPGEGRVVVPALAMALSSVAAAVLATIAADTVFVTTFDLQKVSGFYAVTAVARVGVALAWAAAASRLGGPRFDAATLAIAACVLGLAGAVVTAGGVAVTYGACLAVALVAPLLPVIGLDAIMRGFRARQAKRLLPLVAAAATVGSILGGALASVLVARIGTAALLYVAAGSAAVGATLPGLLARGDGDEEAAPRDTASLATSAKLVLDDASRVPIVRVAMLNAFFVAAVAVLVDFAFKAAVKARYGRDEMAGYFAVFGMISNSAILAAQLFFTSRLVGRFGLGAALRALPATVVALGPLLIFAPGALSASALKLGEACQKFAIAGPIGEVLLTAVGPAARARAKVAARNVAAPLGGLLASAFLVAFGPGGPPAWAVGGVVTLAGAAALVALGGAQRAYAEALAGELGDAPAELDVSPASVNMLRGELLHRLGEALAGGDAARVADALAMMSDKLFSLRDVGPALAFADPAVRAEACRAAVRLARPGEGDELLRLAPADADDALEAELLAAARRLDATPPRHRIDRALARGARDEAASLWAEALACLARTERDPALKQLRKAARGPDGPRRAAAMRAMGELGDRRAEADVLLGLGSTSNEVFAEAAIAAVRLDAQGAVPTLIAELVEGPHVRAAARALSLAGPAAVAALVAALPVTRGEGGLATAVAGHGRVAGTVRAARVLARIGPEACRHILERYGELGYRARNAVARALAAVPRKTGAALDPASVTRAIETNLLYGEALLAQGVEREGLYATELARRIAETGERVLDLAAATFDRAMIARARAALLRDRHGMTSTQPGQARASRREHETALELLETVLPQSLARRTVALLEGRAAGAPPANQKASVDGWLAKCRDFDAGALPSGDPMSSVLSKLLVLKEASLFTGLSGEELYPVAEIAEPVSFRAGDAVVKAGDPGDALYVVETGRLEIVRGDTVLRSIERGAVFGEMALLDGSPRAASVVARTDGRVYRIPRAEFEVLLDESPEIARGVIKTLLGHLRNA